MGETETYKQPREKKERKQSKYPKQNALPYNEERNRRRRWNSRKLIKKWLSRRM